MDSGPALRVDALCKSFGDRVALRDVSFTAAAGEVIAVIGPNGAGKTTLLSILAGNSEADSGAISDPGGQIGWVPQKLALYRRLTVAENLRLFARLEGAEDVEATVETMLAQTGLADRRDDQLVELSGGNQQRVNIAVGLLAEPSVLLLDEPSTGLDARQRVLLWEFVNELARTGTTVLFSTHHIHEAERYGMRLIVLDEGELTFLGTPAQLREIAGDGDTDFEAAFVSFLEERGS